MKRNPLVAPVTLVVNGVTVWKDDVWLTTLTTEQVQTLVDAFRPFLNLPASTDLPKSA